ncbi:methyltransferase domain-containing protein [Maricaulis sp.]|uniref:methyltransferase domain-containing protein n=1 Tax=Maricaulis sp. TaxID=1486257 RepID=UPI00260D4A4E|nr:methyltransferase domain-containing protein [Maricaulis sp.]
MDERISTHAEVLARKPMLADVFREIHEAIWQADQDHVTAPDELLRVELGAGVAPIRDSFPGVLSTDVVDAPGIDQVVNAQDMPFDDASVRALYGQNCFHHFPDPDLFFKEASRVLAPGGGIILIEPYYSPLSQLIYPHLFKTETFDMKMDGWKAPISGPMEGANQALSYIVFKRDRGQFEEMYPEFEIAHQHALVNYPRYLLSGGLNFPQLIPNFMAPVVKGMEFVVSPLRGAFALHHLIVITKAK